MHDRVIAEGVHLGCGIRQTARAKFLGNYAICRSYAFDVPLPGICFGGTSMTGLCLLFPGAPARLHVFAPAAGALSIASACEAGRKVLSARGIGIACSKSMPSPGVCRDIGLFTIRPLVTSGCSPRASGVPITLTRPTAATAAPIVARPPLARARTAILSALAINCSAVMRQATGRSGGQIFGRQLASPDLSRRLGPVTRIISRGRRAL